MFNVFTLLVGLLGAPVTPSVVVAGDSVIATFGLADNAAPQPAAVDSVEFTTSAGGVTKVIRVGKQAGVTTARFAFPLTLWTPGNTAGGPLTVRLGRIAPVAACPTGMCWSSPAVVGSPWFWAYLLNSTPPNAPEAAKITLQSVVLN